MRHFYTLVALLACVILPQSLSAQHFSQDSTWTFGGNVSLSFNQTSFSNWAAGGDNAIGVDAQLNYSADYKKDKHIFDNRVELAYGLNDTETIGSRKTNDKIYLSSIYGYNIAKNLYASSLFNFQTQFAKGYSYDDDLNRTLVSTFMSPGYLTIGAGLTWTPKEWFSATATPLTWREVFVLEGQLSDEGAFGVTPGQKTIEEMGANAQLEVKKDIMKSVNLYSRVILFSNYLDKPKNVDVNWEVQLNMTINKWLSAFITTNLLYDDDIDITKKDGSVGPGLQFKEVVGVGLQLTL